jgi:WD40 repeat protein
MVFKFTGHTDAVGALLLDSDRACVVSGSKDGTVRAFDLRTGKNRLHMTTHLGGVVSLVMDPTGDEGRGVYLSGAKDSTVNVWARNGQGLRTLRCHRYIMCLCDLYVFSSSRLILSSVYYHLWYLCD